MAGDETKRASKHKHRHDSDDREHKSKRRHRDKADKESSRKRSRKDDGGHLHIVDDDANDEDMWVEKNIDMDGEKVRRPLPVRDSSR